MSAGAMALTGVLAVGAQTDSDILRVRYADGVKDYINSDEVSRITYTESIEPAGQGFGAVKELFDLLKKKNPNYMNDFGYPTLMLGMDHQTADLYTPTGQYILERWRAYQHNVFPAKEMWSHCFNFIQSSNEILKSCPVPSTDEEKFCVAQALALRSFSYWNLVQTFAHNVKFAPDAAAVPIVTETNNSSAFEGTPLALSTTTQVYDLILADIDRAIALLEDCKLVPAMVDTERAKRYIDLGTACGLRARYSLTMHRYDEAAAFARRAIDASSARPLPMEVASHPGFQDAKYGNWMWAVIFEETDPTASSHSNFGGNISSFAVNGAAAYWDAFAFCGPVLWDYLSKQSGDVRINWFLDDNFQHPFLTAGRYNLMLETLTYSTPHANVKFDVYKRKIYGTVRAEDVPLMRIEEMYLIEAEGLAMSGKTVDAREKLNGFVQTYRNPYFACRATDAETIREDVLWQRRIELWGEGLAYFDMLRLQRDLDRADAYCPENGQLRIRGGSKYFLYPIPGKLKPFIEGYTEPGDDYPVTGGTWNE